MVIPHEKSSAQFSRLDIQVSCSLCVYIFQMYRFPSTILASVLCTHSHVVQFLNAEWQQLLSVSYHILFYLSLSSPPRLDPSLDIYSASGHSNQIANDIKDTRDI